MKWIAMVSLVLGCAVLMGCVPAVLGPTGQPLTDPQIEALVELHDAGDDSSKIVHCRWTHGVDDRGRPAIGTHTGNCPMSEEERQRLEAVLRRVGASPEDTLETGRTREVGAGYDPRPGTPKRFYLRAYHPTRCRIERARKDELGRLRCWTEHV